MKNSNSVAAVVRIAETHSGNTKKQIKELKRCVREGRKAGDFPMVGAAYCLLSEAYSREDDLHGMLVNSLKAVTILKNTDEHELLAKSYFVLGQAYINQGGFQMSLVCDELAYGIVKRHRIKGETRIMALNNLSVSYHAMEEPRKSIKYLNECINLLKKDCGDNATDLFMYSINLAGCYKDVGEFDRAEEVFDSVNGLAACNAVVSFLYPRRGRSSSSANTRNAYASEDSLLYDPDMRVFEVFRHGASQRIKIFLEV